MSVRPRGAKSEEERQRLLDGRHPLDSVDPLDEEQQEKVVAELRATAERQAANARRMFFNQELIQILQSKVMLLMVVIMKWGPLRH